MKTGLLTYHFGHNYGAMLQAYAMQAILRRLGHDPRFIYYRQDFTFVSKYEREKIRSLKALVKALPFMLLRTKLRDRFDRFEEFLASELALTKRYPTIDALMQDLPDVEAYVCGSDQIWNLQNGVMGYFFGKFVPESCRLISYAPSMGNDIMPDEHREEVRELLKRFDAISVREESGRKLIQELTDKPVAKVIDPVFLVEDEAWHSLERAPNIDVPYIAFYSLESSPRTSRIVKRLAKTLKMPVVVLGKGGSFVFTCRTKIAVESGPREFLGWIRGAKLVITNSFHATAFSVKFRVPFVTISHSHRNARMRDFLTDLGIADRLISTADELSGDIGWLFESFPASVSQGLEAQINASWNYLATAMPSPIRNP
jgi:hypothetical protein